MVKIPDGKDRGKAVTPDLAGVTLLQLRRYSPVSLEGVLALPAGTVRAFEVAARLGKVVRSDGSFEPLRTWDDLLCVEVRPNDRDKVLKLLGFSHGYWRKLVRMWTTVRMAHRCRDLKRGSVVLFLWLESSCPKCGEPTEFRNQEFRSSGTTSFAPPEPVVLQIVPKQGDAPRDERGEGVEQFEEEAGDSKAVEEMTPAERKFEQNGNDDEPMLSRDLAIYDLLTERFAESNDRWTVAATAAKHGFGPDDIRRCLDEWKAEWDEPMQTPDSLLGSFSSIGRKIQALEEEAS